MIPMLLLRVAGVAAPSWLTKSIGYLIDALLIIALLGGVYFAIYHKGASAGAAKVEAKAAVKHAAAVAEARQDERVAQATTDRIGARTERMDAATTDYLRSQLEELHHEIDTARAATPAAPAVPVDTPRVSASLDALIDRANGAAGTADVEP